MYARLFSRLVAVIAFAIVIFAAVPACEVTSRWSGADAGLIDAGVADSARPDLPYRMPTPITPNAIPSIVTTLPAPNDGEIANSVSLTQFVTPLVDDVEAFRLLTYGGGMRRRVTGTDNTTMTIKPIGAVVLRTGGTWKAYAHTVSTSVNPTNLAGGALAASTRYWIYAYDNAGVLDFTASTTAPDAGMRYMTGNTAYFYVSMFCTTSLSNLMSYTQTDNEYTLAAANVLLNGNATVTTPIPITSCVPPQATRLRYLATVNASAAGRYASLSDSSGQETVRLVDNGTISWSTYGDFALTPYPSIGYNGVFSYNVSNVGTALTVDITGFIM